jgi:hypothetical protein
MSIIFINVNEIWAFPLNSHRFLIGFELTGSKRKRLSSNQFKDSLLQRQKLLRTIISFFKVFQFFSSDNG